MYGKFFASAFSGSMMASGPEVFAVWAYVIAHASQSRVELNPRFLAAVIGSTPDRMQAAIDTLCAEDPQSRSKEEHGKRLIREGEFQYIVVNHEKYRSIRNEDDRREYNREAKRRERERSKVVKPSVNDSQSCQHLSAHTEADTDTEEKKKTTRASRTPSVSKPESVSDRVWSDWLAQRKASRATVTETALAGIKREAAKAGLSLQDALAMSCERGWRGFKADWIKAAAVDAVFGAGSR